VTGRRLGVDVGGTFTDLVAVGPDGVEVRKEPSTPTDPSMGVRAAVEAADVRGPKNEDADVDGSRDCAADLDATPDEGASTAVGFFGHGTTVATNAVLESEWAETALVTTAGFRDVLEIGRQDRPAIYDLHAEKATPIVPRDRRFEVTERLDETGSIETAIDESDLEAVAETVQDSAASAVAVSLLFAFEDPTHEERVAEALRAAGFDGPVSLSSTVRPEIGEYERTQTTALNAALAPVLDRYLDRLESWVREQRVAPTVQVMQSSGGLAPTETVRRRPVTTLLSGPAAGVQGAATVAARCGAPDCLTLDMGGTSTDVSLVDGGDPITAQTTTVGEYTVSVPTVDVHSVGAGGGSIAWVDDGGALRVGPRSAGADPGPICYGRGGTRPTVTDAQVVLGRLTPALFADDAVGTDEVGEDRIREAIDAEIAGPLDLTVTEAATGIVDLATHRMADAIRVVSVERGHDPREYALVAFGGAGPLHAADLARELECDGVIVPNHAGVLSALGLTCSDVLADRSVSHVRRWDAVDLSDLAATFDELIERAAAALETADVPPADRQIERRADCRYVGQDHELSVPVPEGPLEEAVRETVARRFHERHRERFGHAAPDEPVELVTVRVRARGTVESPSLERRSAPGASLADAERTTRPVTFDGERRETPVYEWAQVPAAQGFDGPAIVAGDQSTVLVPPTARARVDGDGNVQLEVDA
jgi:N-methylhydantoinase A